MKSLINLQYATIIYQQHMTFNHIISCCNDFGSSSYWFCGLDPESPQTLPIKRAHSKINFAHYFHIPWDWHSKHFLRGVVLYLRISLLVLGLYSVDNLQIGFLTRLGCFYVTAILSWGYGWGWYWGWGWFEPEIEMRLRWDWVEV